MNKWMGEYEYWIKDSIKNIEIQAKIIIKRRLCKCEYSEKKGGS